MLSLNEIDKMIESGYLPKNGGKTVRVNEANPTNTARIKKNLWESKEMKYMRESFKKKWDLTGQIKPSFQSWKMVLTGIK